MNLTQSVFYAAVKVRVTSESLGPVGGGGEVCVSLVCDMSLGYLGSIHRTCV